MFGACRISSDAPEIVSILEVKILFNKHFQTQLTFHAYDCHATYITTAEQMKEKMRKKKIKD